jgi:hypothetical protein
MNWTPVPEDMIRYSAIRRLRYCPCQCGEMIPLDDEDALSGDPVPCPTGCGARARVVIAGDRFRIEWAPPE